MSSISFTELLRNAFTEEGTKKQFGKGDYLIKAGTIEKNLYFIESGAVRVFYRTETEEQIVRFGYEGSIINSLASFYTSSPSEFYIEAIRKTKVISITKEKTLSIAHQNMDTVSQYVQLLEATIAQQIDREIDLLITSPAQRLNRVLRRSPNLFQQIPLKYIASYLRMKPETLSRIRNS